MLDIDADLFQHGDEDFIRYRCLCYLEQHQTDLTSFLRLHLSSVVIDVYLYVASLSIRPKHRADREVVVCLGMLLLSDELCLLEKLLDSSLRGSDDLEHRYYFLYHESTSSH